MSDLKNIDLKELGKVLAIPAKYFTKHSNTEVDNELLAAFTEEFNNGSDVKSEDVVASAFALVKVVTKATKTKIDDVLVGLIENSLGAFGLLDKFKEVISKVEKTEE